MPSRRTYLASLASLGSSAALAGCSALEASPLSGDSGGSAALGSDAMAQRNARPIPAGQSGDHQIGRFSAVTVDYDALATRLTEDQRRTQHYWYLEDSPVDDVVRYQIGDASQPVGDDVYSMQYAHTTGDVDREAVRSEYGLSADASTRHRGFDCYGGPDEPLGQLTQSVAVADDALVALFFARKSGTPQQCRGLEYAIELATGDGQLEGWLGDAFGAAAPAHEVAATYEAQDTDDPDAATADLSAVRVRDSEVVSTDVHAHASSSGFQSAWDRRGPGVFGVEDGDADVETRDRMAIWRRSESHEAFFSEDDA